ncbi:hypothetical protein D083_1054 [Dickeya solani RNS 08.23.3.1.A]|nr:hypothetical protein D083_1054 [Dickeya solani RNS 08.23.3.1.A]
MSSIYGCVGMNKPQCQCLVPVYPGCDIALSTALPGMG